MIRRHFRMVRLFEIFENAVETVRYPAIRIRHLGAKIELRHLPARGQYNAAVKVVSRAETEIVHGRLVPRLYAIVRRESDDVDSDLPCTVQYFHGGQTWVPAILAQLEADTDAFLAVHGRETGVCSLCGRTLTDDPSLKAGYGPVCADKWGLPWGDRG